MKRSLTSPRMLLTSLALAAVFTVTTLAQQPGASLRMRASQYKIGRLAPGALADQSTFAVDRSNLVTVEIMAAIGGVGTSVMTPSGQSITPETVGSLGGSYNDISSSTTPSGTSILPALTPNHHYVYSFPSQGAGTYIVHFQAPASLGEEVAVLVELTTDSPIVSTLFATESRVFAGRPAVLSAALFDGQSPIPGAAIEVDVKNESGATVTLVLRDDANPADAAAGDGLYSAEFTPTAPGRYSALAVINGTSPGGITFTRHSLAEFTVAAAPGRLTGNAPDRGIDDNGDGMIDRVSFDVGAQVTTPGTYRAFVHLKTAGGKTLVGSGEADLLTGTGNVAVDVDAADLRATGEGGSYAVTLIELDALETARQITVDRRENAGQTQPYSFGSFQRDPLVLTGVVSDFGIDDNGNGRFDRLRVKVQVDVLRAGFYRWNLKLTDQDSSKIDFARGQGFFSAGLNDMTVDFNGYTIGSSGARGAFHLEDLLLFGPKATIATDVGQTGSYRSIQFENGRDDGGDGGADSIAPNVNASLSAQANAAGWHNADVTLRFNATDNAGGSGVRDITYSSSGAQFAAPATIGGASASLTISGEGTTIITFSAHDHAGNASPPRTLTVRLDKTAPTVKVASPAGSLLLNQSAVADYACADANSGVSACVGSLPNGSAISTSAVGLYRFVVTATDVAGNSAVKTIDYSVSYGISLKYDPAKVSKSGSTIPIKIQLVDANGVNVSAPGILVHASGTLLASDFAPGAVEDAGNANPDDNFRFVNFEGQGGYIFNLKTTGLATGTYVLLFSAGGDPSMHAVGFQIK